MSKWDKISLFKFQQISAINDRVDIPDIDKTLFSTCAVFDLTEYELDNMEPKKAKELILKIQGIFTSSFNPCAPKRIGKYIINYDPSSLTFGQYIDLSFFLQAPVPNQAPIQNAHYALASIARGRFRKYNSDKHRHRAEYFLLQPIEKVMGGIMAFAERFKDFNNEYKTLFGLDAEVHGEDAKSDRFNKRYGWIYSASAVAEYERITVEAAFALPIRRALNDLAYLKAKSKYEAELSERIRNNTKAKQHG